MTIPSCGRICLWALACIFAGAALAAPAPEEAIRDNPSPDPRAPTVKPGRGDSRSDDGKNAEARVTQQANKPGDPDKADNSPRVSNQTGGPGGPVDIDGPDHLIIEVVGPRIHTPVIKPLPPVPGPTRVTESQPSRQAPFADVVSIHRAGANHCTGVAVTRELILTAAHCLPARQVGAGRFAARPRALRRVIESARAPGGIDAALLRLEAPLDIDPSPLREDAGRPYGEGRVVGFGATDGAGRRGAGIRGEGTVWFDGWGCDRLRAARAGCRPGAELVIAGAGGADTCDGDSGGPVFERSTRGWRVLAITARPLRRSRHRCGDGGIYVRVDRLQPWIRQTRARWLGEEAGQ